MAKTWVLRTETKGTGAQVVPLEPAPKGPAAPRSDFVKTKAARRAPEPEVRAPRRFRVVDVVTRETLIDDADGRAAMEALKDVRSVVDVDVYVWREDRQRWRRLTLEEQRAMLALAQGG